MTRARTRECHGSLRIAVAAAWAVAMAACTEPEAPTVAASSAAVELADHIYTNAQVLTVDADFGVAEALAVRGQRVLAVGPNDAMLELVTADTVITDLEGRTVIPGLIDNHMHFVRATRDWYRHVRWDNVTSRAAALELLATRAEGLPEGEWVLVIGGWSFAQFGDDGANFTLAELDAVLPDRPIYIQEAYRRGFANTAAINAAARSPVSSAENRAALNARAGGQPASAEFAGSAMSLITAAIPAVSDATWDRSMQAAIRDLHSFGLTTVYDVGGNSVEPAHYETLRRIAQQGDLSMRVFYTLNSQGGVGSSADEIIAALSAQSPELTALEFARFGWGESTFAPMRAAPWHISAEDLQSYERIALTAAGQGWQLHEHTMREEKAAAMLDVFEAVNRQRSITAARWTIAHTNGISAATIARANALGMVFAVHSSSRLATRAQFLAGAKPPPLGAITASGGIWGLGSDATTVASPNPMHNIGWVVSGLSPGGERNLETTVSREAALTAHTRSNAYMLFREAHLGSLEPGKLADFVVLDNDYLRVPADEIKNLRSVMTVVGGEVVFTTL